MADDLFPGLVICQGHLTIGAFGRFGAGLAVDNGGITTPVVHNDDLLTPLKRLPQPIRTDP